MVFEFSNPDSGTLAFIEDGGIRIPFHKTLGPSFYVKNGLDTQSVVLKKNAEGFVGKIENVIFSLAYEVRGHFLDIIVKIENKGDAPYEPTAIALKLGIDSYMESYPEWNNKLFPTLLRSEKTHFTAYMRSPLGHAVGIVSEEPVAAWELDYNTTPGVSDEECDFGHRIYTANLLLCCNAPLPERHPKITGIAAGETREWRISLFTLQNPDDFFSIVSKDFNLPVIHLDLYTYPLGSVLTPKVESSEAYELRLYSPSGKASAGTSFTLDEYGLYTLEVTTAAKTARSTVYVRHDYGWYLKAARKWALTAPQKASTHTESWYGWFSAFLAAKHYPDAELDAMARMNFDEVAPLMFDFERGVPTVIQSRVQNLALFISVLVDLYEANPSENGEFLEYANRFADELMKRQTPDGAYRRKGTHYTSVIYIAKSMLELALCEKELADDTIFHERYTKHYASAKAAVDELALHREQIGTEGEHTLEDGMISCSALQLGFFALTLPEEERSPYIEAAEYLLKVHACLEQKHIPDARMRGVTLRFWEAQYDVMIRANMINSPHGWTSWKNYATYYLYLLTGKREYLIDTLNTMGACLSTVKEDGEVRWAFIADPYIHAKVFVPDTEKPVADGLKSVRHISAPAYRGKYEYKTFGECYVSMISTWFRTGEQLLTGGYQLCPLIFDDHQQKVDNQGGACDNDAHEHFKCLEETLLKKCFVIVRDENAEGFGCTIQKADGVFEVVPTEECTFVHVNTDTEIHLIILGKTYALDRGLHMLNIIS